MCQIHWKRFYVQASKLCAPGVSLHLSAFAVPENAVMEPFADMH